PAADDQDPRQNQAARQGEGSRAAPRPAGRSAGCRSRSGCYGWVVVLYRLESEPCVCRTGPVYSSELTPGGNSTAQYWQRPAWRAMTVVTCIAGGSMPPPIPSSSDATPKSDAPRTPAPGPAGPDRGSPQSRPLATDYAAILELPRHPDELGRLGDY